MAIEEILGLELKRQQTVRPGISGPKGRDSIAQAEGDR
jgi:hypothetical protein